MFHPNMESARLTMEGGHRLKAMDIVLEEAINEGKPGFGCDIWNPCECKHFLRHIQTYSHLEANFNRLL
jgi:hypothetical protein